MTDVSMPNSASMIAKLTERVRDFPCGGIKLAMCIPSYGHLEPSCEKDVRAAMMVASLYGVVWVGDVSPDRMGYSSARNQVAQAVLDSPDIDGVMWIDSDMRIEPGDVARLMISARAFNAEFVTGVYHKRGEPYDPVFYTWSKRKKVFQSFEDYPINMFAPIEGCGFGFVYTHRSVLEAIAKHPSFDKRRGWFPDDRDNGGMGEDLNFCKQAMTAEKQLYVNTAIILAHSGDPELITRETFMARRPDRPERTLFVGDNR